MARKQQETVRLRAKRGIYGRSLEGRELTCRAGQEFETDNRTAADLLNAGYAEPVKSRAKKEQADEE